MTVSYSSVELGRCRLSGGTPVALPSPEWAITPSSDGAGPKRKVGVMRFLGVALVGASLMVPGGAAWAEGGVAVKNLLGTMGLIPKEREQITYRERPPLVLPPKTDLR